MKKVLFGLLVLVFSASVLANEKNLVRGNNKFAIELYRVLLQRKGDENILVAPYSISSALAMTWAGALNNTEKEMKDVLNFLTTQKETHEAFRNINEVVAASKDIDGYELAIANRLWGHDDFHFRSNFIDWTETYYNAGLVRLNFFKRPEESRLAINEWIEEQTNNKIRNLIPMGAITPITRLVLTNAVYFLAEWGTQFKEYATRDEDFNKIEGEKVNVSMMYNELNTKYYFDSTLETHVLQMPYKAGGAKRASMIFFVPAQNDGIKMLDRKITSKKIENIITKLSDQKVIFSLPKFKIEDSFSLAEALTQMGMKDAFSPDNANFENMAYLTPEQNLFITKILHKTFIEVDEGGTEAAGATAVIVGLKTTSIEPVVEKKVVKADHPFMFIIRDDNTGSIIFAGKLMNPEKN